MVPVADLTVPSNTDPRPFSARVLLVEDNLINQQVAEEMLQHLGCTVTVANDGIEGVAAYRDSTYDVVLMDCQMPRLDGLAATREIRAYESERGSAHVPIIAVTASSLVGGQESCFEAGMDDFLAKPYTLKELETMLRRHLAE